MKKFMLLLALVVTVSLTNAQTTIWKIDPAHSNISFSVDYMVLTEVNGNFKEFSGTVQKEGNDFSKSTIEVTINALSITTENEKRDGHLKSADFFDVAKYPSVIFAGKSFEKTGENTYNITGDLTMHGITKTVVISAKYAGEAKDPWGNTREGFKGTTSVDRTDFGLVYNSTLETGGLLIGKNVTIALNVQLIKQQQAGTN